MAKKKATVLQGLQEDRTRVTIFLPAQNMKHVRAIRKINVYLHSQRKSKSCQIKGFTTTVNQLTPYFGVWWSPKKKDWISEKVTLLTVDYAKRLDDKNLENSMRRLKQAILDSYKHFGDEQEEIWMVASSVVRFA